MASRLRPFLPISMLECGESRRRPIFPASRKFTFAAADSLSHFYHLFTDHFGMAPQEFRRIAPLSAFRDSLVGDPVLESGIPAGIPFMKTRGPRHLQSAAR